MGIAPVAVYSEADRHRCMSRRPAVCIGPAPAAQSYLAAHGILAAAKATGAEAADPDCPRTPSSRRPARRRGSSSSVRGRSICAAFGLKHKAREIAPAAGVPLAPGSGLLENLAAAET